MREKINRKIAGFFTLLPAQVSANRTNYFPVQKQSRAYIVECEALRGLAILLVLLFHASLRLQKDDPITPNLLNSFMLAGNTGVTLFFVLSGFLLNLPFMSGGPIQPRDFFIKRALRIMPMYSCMVIIGAIYRDNVTAGITSLLFLNTKVSTLFPFGAVWWSLVVEVQFYLLLPYLHLLWRSQRWRWIFLPTSIAACYIYLDITRSEQDGYYFFDSARNSILALWPTFLCGAILAAIHTHYGDKIKAFCHSSMIFRFGAADLILCALILLLASILLKASIMGYINAYMLDFHHVVFEAFFWTCIIAVILYTPARIKHLLTNPALVFLGIISYSLYLLHAPILFFGLRYLSHFTFGGHKLSLLVMLLICVGASTVLAAITYYLIEKPMLDLKKKFSGKNGA